MRKEELTHDQERWLALATLLIGQLMIALDVSVVNIALPTIARDLQLSQAHLAWIVNAYLLAFGGFILIAGRLGDLFGQKRIFLLGMTIFTAASFVCGAASNPIILILSRFLQGFGGALVSAVILGILYTLFTEHHLRAKSLGFYALVGAAGAVVGLVAGGFLVQVLNWHWIFYVNIPFGVGAVISGWYLIPHDHITHGSKNIDVLGAILLTGIFVALNYGLINAGYEGWSSTTTLLSLGGAVLLLGLLIWLETSIENPLIPARIFSIPNIRSVNVAQMLSSVPLLSSFFFIALYFQQVLGFSPLETGLAFVPQTATFGIMGILLVPPIIKRLGSKTTLFVGLPITVLALFLFTFLPAAHVHYWLDIVPIMILFSIGAMLTSILLIHLGMSGVPKGDAGLASGIINTSKQMGGAIGVALLSSIAASYTSSVLHSGVSETVALNEGYHVAFLVSIIAVIATGVVLARVQDLQMARQETPEEKALAMLEVEEMA